MKILNINPIILPPILFKDKYCDNSYIDTNPSMFIENNGDVKILIRRINYRKFINKSFITYKNFTDSKYSILTGKINENQPLSIEDMTYNDINYEYKIPTYSSYWYGLEDIRFINNNTILTIIPECNNKGNPSIFRATIDNTTLHSFISCYPDIIEKNWMPYSDNNGTQKVIYSLNPFKIKSIVDDDIQLINQSENIMELLKDYHGSTNGIEYGYNSNCRLFLIHTSKEKSYHRWIIFNLNDLSLKISDEFTFFKHSYIEFTCSLCKYNDRIFVSIGINDDKAFIIELRLDDLVFIN